jgi:hypothetical protein
LDNAGLFGSAGGSVVGDKYTVIYAFNITKVGSVYYEKDENYYIYGGSIFPDTSSPFLGAAIIINNHVLLLADNGTEGGMVICTYSACGGASGQYNEVYSIEQFSGEYIQKSTVRLL